MLTYFLVRAAHQMACGLPFDSAQGRNGRTLLTTLRTKWCFGFLVTIGVRKDEELVFGCDELDQISKSARITPFVVVPGKHFDEITIHDCCQK